MLSLVVAPALGLVVLIAAVVGVAGLLIPVSAPRNNEDEAPLKYDCGTPAAFIVGRGPAPEPLPVTFGAPSRDFSKDDACREAMAPRLGLTTWAFGVGMVVALLLGVTLLTASSWTPRREAMGVALLLVVIGLALSRTHPTRPVAACDVLPAGELAGVLDTAPPAPIPFEPEGPGRHSTGCSYRAASGAQLTVFAISPGGKAFEHGKQVALADHVVEQRDISGPGYLAYTTGGPRERSESAVVVHGDRYVNVVVYGAPPGTAARLAPVAARRLALWWS